MIQDRGRVIGPAAFLLVAILLGGSQQSALFTLIGQLAAIALLGVSIATMSGQRLPAGSVPAFGFIALLLLAPLAQLVPLPHSLWSSLPGRAFAADVLGAAGLPAIVHPLSLTPDDTLRDLMSFMPPIAMFVATLGLTTDERRALIPVIAAAALASALLGLLQIMGTAGYLYDYTHRGNATGIFANRNHQADLMLLAALLTAAFASSARVPARLLPVAAALVLLFAASAIATTSRAGTAFAPLVVAAAAYLLTRGGGLKLRPVVVGGLIAAAVGATALIVASPVVQGVIARYSSDNGDRAEFRADTRVAIGQFWPAGSGLGSFDEVYRSIENLDTMSSLGVNHAHNEYLELILELGVLAPILFLFFLVLVALRLAGGAASPRGEALRLAGALGIGLLLLHSTVDYPLRMPGIAVLFAFCCALLHVPSAQARNGRRSVSAGHDPGRARLQHAKS